MSEVFIAFAGLNLITLVQFIMITNQLDKLEQKIDKLKGKEDGNNK